MINDESWKWIFSGFGVLVFLIIRGRTHWQWWRRFWGQADVTHRVRDVVVSDRHFGGNEVTLWRPLSWRAGVDLRHLVGVVGHVDPVDGDGHGRSDFEDPGRGGKVRGRWGRSHSRVSDGLVLTGCDRRNADGRNLKKFNSILD